MSAVNTSIPMSSTVRFLPMGRSYQSNWGVNCLSEKSNMGGSSSVISKTAQLYDDLILQQDVKQSLRFHTLLRYDNGVFSLNPGFDRHLDTGTTFVYYPHKNMTNFNENNENLNFIANPSANNPEKGQYLFIVHPSPILSTTSIAIETMNEKSSLPM